jgi:hypothetical protein
MTSRSATAAAAQRRSAWSEGIVVVLLSVLLFVAALGTHEVMHLVVLYAVGGHGALVVRPWRMGLLEATIYALHVQPDQPIGLARQAAVNFLGPALAGVPLAVLLAYVRDPVARAALVANVAILAFYAVIELGDLLVEELLNVDLPFLTTPEFNYGVPLGIVTVAAFIVATQRRSQH